MGDMVPRDEDFTIDLENGASASGEERNKELVSDTRQEKSVLGKIWGSLDGLVRDEESLRSYDVTSTSNAVATENANSLGEKHLGEEGMALLEKKREKEKRKKLNSKKAPKPPRPPKGPSLDAADQKLVQEMSELAMLKRARLERMRAQKKKRRATKKSASSSSNLCALGITILFILVIIFQGILSKESSRVSFEGSPGASNTGPFISVQLYKNLSSTRSDAPGSEPPKYASLSSS